MLFGTGCRYRPALIDGQVTRPCIELLHRGQARPAPLDTAATFPGIEASFTGQVTRGHPEALQALDNPAAVILEALAGHERSRHPKNRAIFD